MRAIVSAPERLMLIAVSLAVAAGLAVSLGQHHPWTVLPLAALLVAAGWRPLAPTPDSTRRAVWGSAALLAAVVAWIVVNAAMAAEFMIVVRDPGFLTLSGMWLTDHPHTDIPALGAVEAASLEVNLLADAAQAWNLRGDVIQPQGAKMLPATIAIGGWIAGQSGVLAANVVIGAMGLVAVYVLARRFLGPLASLAPVGALAATVAHIALSRSAYTEPLTLLLVVAGVSWGWKGVTDHRIGPLIAAAVVSGATSYIRIDGAAFAVGALAGVVVALALSDEDRAWRRHALLAFAGVQATVLLTGYAALWRWSEAYLERLSSDATALIAGYVLCALAAAVWALTWNRRLRADRLLAAPVARMGRSGALIVGGGVVMVLTILASRPWWTTVHRGTEQDNHVFANGVVERFQRSQGLPIDGTRTYAEHTVTWLSYYFTWPLVIAGIIGFGIMGYRMLRHDRGWAVLLGAILAPTLLYLWTPSIIPDQIWAIRRFEPATIPGFALAAALAGWALVTRLSTPSRRDTGKRLVAAAMVLLPLTTWVSIVPDDRFPVATATPVTTREMLGARAQINGLCDLADGRPIILAGTSSHFGSLRTVCNVPVVLALRAPTTDTLATLSAQWDRTPLVLTREPDWFTWTTAPSVVLESTVVQAGYSLQRIPRSVIRRGYNWHAGLVTAQGEVTPVTPSTP